MKSNKPELEYDENEKQERFEAALKSALKTLHKPLKEKKAVLSKRDQSRDQTKGRHGIIRGFTNA